MPSGILKCNSFDSAVFGELGAIYQRTLLKGFQNFSKMRKRIK